MFVIRKPQAHNSMKLYGVLKAMNISMIEAYIYVFEITENELFTIYHYFCDISNTNSSCVIVLKVIRNLIYM